MKQKDTVELDVAAALKAARTAIRLKHSVAADEEINRVLPEISSTMMAAAANGKPYKLDLARLFAS